MSALFCPSLFLRRCRYDNLSPPCLNLSDNNGHSSDYWNESLICSGAESWIWKIFSESYNEEVFFRSVFLQGGIYRWARQRQHMPSRNEKKAKGKIKVVITLKNHVNGGSSFIMMISFLSNEFPESLIWNAAGLSALKEMAIHIYDLMFFH